MPSTASTSSPPRRASRRKRSSTSRVVSGRISRRSRSATSPTTTTRRRHPPPTWPSGLRSRRPSEAPSPPWPSRRRIWRWWIDDATWLPPLLAATPKPSLITPDTFYIADADDPSATIATLISPAGVPFASGQPRDPRERRTRPLSDGGDEHLLRWRKSGVSNTLASALRRFGLPLRHRESRRTAQTSTARTHPTVLGDANGVVTSIRPIYYGCSSSSSRATASRSRHPKTPAGPTSRRLRREEGDGTLGSSS